MDAAQAAEVIRDVANLDVRNIRPIVGGWDSWTFEVDGRWIFRFPRSREVAASTGAEMRFLPALAEHVDFEVPNPGWSGLWDGQPFFGYPRVDGRALEAADVDRTPGVDARLASMIHQIHSFDVVAARELLGVEGSRSEWRRQYEGFRIDSLAQMSGLLDSSTTGLVERGFALFLGNEFEFTPVPVHRDLGAEHILVDDGSGWPIGMIDFGDAGVGDPAIDFVGLWIALGPERAQVTLAAYPGPVDAGFVERIKAYWWIGSVHAVLYGIAQNDRGVVEEGLIGLRQRLAELDL